jgi:hypothetical protein
MHKIYKSMKVNRIGIWLTAAMVWGTNAAAELTEEDVFTLGDHEDMAQILCGQMSPYGCYSLASFLRNQFSEYVGLWLQKLDYVSREAPKERWDDADKARVWQWVYLLPINDLIQHWQRWLEDNPYVDGLSFAFDLFSEISKRLLNIRSLLRQSDFLLTPPGGKRYKLCCGTLRRECKIRYFLIQAALKTATEECQSCIKSLKELRADSNHKGMRLGICASLAFIQDYEGWLSSGEFKWGNWRTFQRQESWRWRYDIGNLRADFYFIIRFFLIQLDLLPEMFDLDPLPEEYEAMHQRVEMQLSDS